MAHRAKAAANAVPVIVMMVLALVLTTAASRRPPASVAGADVTVIPKQLGDWKLVDEIPLDENIQKQLLADSHVARRYKNAAGQVIELLVVYRRYGRREFAHRPELCFPAAGYTITGKGRGTLPYAGRDVPTTTLTASAPDGNYRTNLAYFFASGRRTENNFIRQQIWMALERLIPNKNGWTFVRLQAPNLTNDEAGDQAALNAEQEFMRTFAPTIERAITTDRSHNS
jgi:EpsI family protein